MKNFGFLRLVCFLLAALIIIPTVVACADTNSGSEATSATAETQAPAGEETVVETAA